MTSSNWRASWHCDIDQERFYHCLSLFFNSCHYGQLISLGWLCLKAPAQVKNLAGLHQTRVIHYWQFKSKSIIFDDKWNLQGGQLTVSGYLAYISRGTQSMWTSIGLVLNYKSSLLGRANELKAITSPLIYSVFLPRGIL